jgi:tight adherence protein B
MSRLGGALAAAALTLAWAGPAHAAAPILTEGAGAPFPERAYTLTLPAARSIDAGSVRVTENGRPVRGASVMPADGASAHRFGVVLLIDASKSMRGRSLSDAVTAARTFVAHRNAGQPLAIVSFAGRADVLQQFTTDPVAIERGLSGVRLQPGNTHLFDAVSQSVAMIRSARITSGAIIVLSDGGERGSAATLQQVTAAATQAGVRIFAVGLPARHSHFASMSRLAAGTGAEFSSVASTGDLTRVYDRLGSRLASQYLIRYRSTAPPGVRVRVAVDLGPGAGTARTGYATPALQAAAGRPFRRTPAQALWMSGAGALLASLVVALLLAVGLWLVLRPRRGTLRARLAAYVRPVDEGEAASSGELTGRMLDSAARSLERTRWVPRLAERLDIAAISIPAGRLVAYVGAGTLLALAILAAAGGPALALLALVIPGVTWALISRRVGRRRRVFAEQLPDNLQVIASAMRAGHSFSGALATVVDDAPEPTRAELQRVIADERLGVPVEEALAVVARRMDNRDLEQVSLVAALQRETGGNTAEVLDRVTETVRERLALRRLVKTLTAQGRMSRWVVSCLPAGLLTIITLINPDYVAPLYATSFGRMALVVAAVMVVCGSLVIKRIVDIKV